MKSITIINYGDTRYAVDHNGNQYAIHGLIIKGIDKPDKFYEASSSFFKAACPEGTKHAAEEVSAGLVNLF